MQSMSRSIHATASRYSICTCSDRDLIRLCYLVTSAMSTCFLRGQLKYFGERGYKVTLITSQGEGLEELKVREGVEIHCVPMERAIHPIRDIVSIIRIYMLFRTIRPHIVNAGTPKAGLLGMLAAWAARVPVRIYTLHGLRLETTTGLKRRILRFAERIATACAKRVICVSPSLANRLGQICRIDPHKVTVLGSGSCNGLDATQLAHNQARVSQAIQIRTALGISPGEPVIGYVGRLARDKGIADLVKAFTKVNAHYPTSWLLLLGDVDPADALHESTIAQIRTHPRIISAGYLEDVVPYYYAMNLFAFPSYREGFGVAALEAQAAGLPVVGYRATGIVDAVLDGTTGRLVPVGSVDELVAALLVYLDDNKLIAEHGSNGQCRARNEFSNNRIWNALFTEYVGLLQTAGLGVQASASSSESKKKAA